MDSPRRPADMQRWFRFQNVGSDKIPAYAVIGPQTDSNDQYDAIETSDKFDYRFRLGRPTAATTNGQDAGLFYINGSQEIPPKGLGRCTQTGMMQVLIGYETGSPPAWGDNLAIDTTPTDTPFYLVAGAGAYKFVDFDGCPATTFKDSTRSGYTFKVGWVVPASNARGVGGLRILDDVPLVTLASGEVMKSDILDEVDYVSYGYQNDSRFELTDTDFVQKRKAGFVRIDVPGVYLLNLSAAIRATDATVNDGSGSYQPKIVARTTRVGRSSSTIQPTQAAVYALENESGGFYVDGYSSPNNFNALLLHTPEQAADTHDEDGETVINRRLWHNVSGSEIFEFAAGDYFFIYNPTPYEVEVSCLSGSLVLLQGSTTISGASSSSSSGSSGGSGGSSSGSSTELAALDSRVTTAEGAIDTLQIEVDAVEATVSSHTTSIATNAAGISTNAADITAAEADIATNMGDIAALEAIIAAAVSDGAKVTASGDTFTVTNGIITAFTAGPYSLPGTDGTSSQVLTTDGAGNWTWEDASGGTSLTLVEESGSAFRPVTDSATTSGDGTHAWSNGYYDALTLGGVDLDTRIGTIETDVSGIDADLTTAEGNISTNAGNISTNAGDISTLQGYFSGVIADSTFTTAAGDEIVTANGLITSATQGPVTLPGSSGFDKQFLKSNGDGTTDWDFVVHEFWSEVVGTGHLIPATTDTHDIGTTSKRPRNLYLSGDADISGNATVDGTATITGRSSFAAAATFDAGYREPYTDQNGNTQLQFPTASNIILREGADPTTDIEFGSGFCYILDNLGGGDFAYRRIGIVGGWEKQMDSTWAAGDNAGGMQSGDSLSADTLYYVRLIENTTNSRTEIIAYDNTATDPSGYDSGFVAIPIGRFHTGSSGDIEWRASEACLVGDIYHPVAEDLNDADRIEYDATNQRFYGTSAIKQPYGYKITNNTTDADHDLDIEAGGCMSWDRTTWIEGSALTKRFDAAWASGTGNGGMDTGSIPTSGGLYLYAIYHPDDGVDYIGSTTDPTTGPSLPTGYTKYAYIGYRPTDSSANFYSVIQTGTYHELYPVVQFYGSTNPGTSSIDHTVQAPIRAKAQLWSVLSSSSVTTYLWAGNPATTPSVNSPAGNIHQGVSAGDGDRMTFDIALDDSSQMRTRLSASNSGVYQGLALQGWTDTMLQGIVSPSAEGGGGGSAFYGDYITGLLCDSGTDTDHDVDISNGSCGSSDGTELIENSGGTYTIAIDNASHRVDSSTLDTNTDYYVLVGTESGSFVAGFSKVNSLPSGWSNYKAIDIRRTDGTSNLREMYMSDSSDCRRVNRYESQTVDYSGATTPSTAALYSIDVPNVESVEAWCWIVPVNGDVQINHGTLPSPGSGRMGLEVLETTNAHRVTFNVLVNSSGQIYMHYNFNNSTFTFVTRGYSAWRALN